MAATQTATPTVSEFLAAFFETKESIHFRAFPPRGVKGTPRKISLPLGALRYNQSRAKLADLNKTHGVYFVVNAGGDKDIEITGGEEKGKGGDTIVHRPGRFTACFAEADNLPIEEQHAKLDGCPLSPSIRVETKKSVHAYWLLSGENSGAMCEADWREVQHRLIAYFDGDNKIKNPSRVMRVPHFDHLSADGSRKRVGVVVFEPDRKYTLATLLAAFPPASEKNQRTETKSKCGQTDSGAF